MSEFLLVANSTLDEKTEYFTKNRIERVCLMFTIDGETHPDDGFSTMSSKTFYDLLRSGKQSTTTQPSPEAYRTAFLRGLENGQDVLCVTFSSGMSGSYQAATIARDELQPQYPNQKIICFDTLSATGGERILVDKAREMRDAGHSAEEAAALLAELRPKVCVLITVDDLNHLHAGGRLSKTSAIVGGLLGIKPIIYINDTGKIAICDKVRGRTQAMQYLGDRVLHEITDRTQTIRICHGDALEDAEYLQKYLMERGVSSELQLCGTVIGTHGGPGVILACYIGQQREKLPK